MSQSAYPSMIWQTYDYYYDLTGAYFGAKTACEPVHIQWNAATNSVKIINNKPYDIDSLRAEAFVYNMDGKLVPAYTLSKTLDVKSASATEAFTTFGNTGEKPALSSVHFLKLKLTGKAGMIVSENFYWIGNSYLNYSALNTMPGIGKKLTQSKAMVSTAKNGINRLLKYTIVNTSRTTAAFGIRAQLVNRSGKQLLPAIFSDGYFSLMQGEAKSLEVEIDPKLLRTGYKLKLTAYNN